MALIRAFFYTAGICVFLVALVYLFSTNGPVQLGKTLKDKIVSVSRLPETAQRSSDTEEDLDYFLDEKKRELPAEQNQPSDDQGASFEKEEDPEPVLEDIPLPQKENDTFYTADNNTLTTEQMLNILKALRGE